MHRLSTQRTNATSNLSSAITISLNNLTTFYLEASVRESYMAHIRIESVGPLVAQAEKVTGPTGVSKETGTGSTKIPPSSLNDTNSHSSSSPLYVPKSILELPPPINIIIYQRHMYVKLKVVILACI